MSRTWDILSIKRPREIPSTLVVTLEKSVICISPGEELERDGELHFVVGPTFFDSPIIDRKLTFSYEEKPLLDYDYDLVGQIEPGKLISEREKIYLLLEK